MSKLASHNPEELEVYQSWHAAECGEDEIFESWDANTVEPDLIEKVLGAGVLNQYMQWIYFNIK